MTNYSLPFPLALQQNNNNSLANPQPAITHLHYIHTDSTPPITSSTTSVIVINPIYNLLRVFLFWHPSKHTTPDYITMGNQWLIRRRCLNTDYAINGIPIGLLIRAHSSEQQSNPILIICSITTTTTKCQVNIGQKTRTWYSSMNHHSDCLACCWVR